jgi:hypothetical protein
MVDRLTLSLLHDEDADGWIEKDRVEIRINGVPFAHIVSQAGIAKEFLYPPAHLLTGDHFLPGPDRWEDPDGTWFDENETALLGCTCGQAGCDAVVMRIESVAAGIRWSRATRNRPGSEVLTQIGPFIFDKTEYEAELANTCG